PLLRPALLSALQYRGSCILSFLFFLLVMEGPPCYNGLAWVRGGSGVLLALYTSYRLVYGAFYLVSRIALRIWGGLSAVSQSRASRALTVWGPGLCQPLRLISFASPSGEARAGSI